MAIFYLVLPREVFFITINTRGVWSASIRTATLWCLITTFQWGNNVFKHFLRWWEIFSQEEYSPEDLANPCVNYPTEQYESYADCDEQFVRRSLPVGLRPFWAVDNISEATNEVSLNLSGSTYNKDTFGTTCSFLINDRINKIIFQLTCSTVSWYPTACYLVSVPRRPSGRRWRPCLLPAIRWSVSTLITRSGSGRPP